jgi:hypothetical protein
MDLTFFSMRIIDLQLFVVKLLPYIASLLAYLASEILFLYKRFKSLTRNQFLISLGLLVAFLSLFFLENGDLYIFMTLSFLYPLISFIVSFIVFSDLYTFKKLSLFLLGAYLLVSVLSGSLFSGYFHQSLFTFFTFYSFLIAIAVPYYVLEKYSFNKNLQGKDLLQFLLFACLLILVLLHIYTYLPLSSEYLGSLIISFLKIKSFYYMELVLNIRFYLVLFFWIYAYKRFFKKQSIAASAHFASLLSLFLTMKVIVFEMIVPRLTF